MLIQHIIYSTPFIGREKDLQELAHIILHDNARLLTLLGPGGVGKTRLAQRFLERIKSQFSGGAYLISLQEVSNPDYVLPTIAEPVLLMIGGQMPLVDQLARHFGDNNALLLLDSFEHLLPETDDIAALLGAVPNLQIIVTSRERLNLSHEWVYPVGGLSYAQSGDDSQGLAATDALQLFTQRAVQVQHDFNLDDNLPAVQRICKLVHGIPLAIELAASWLNVISCEEIADEITESLDILTTNLRDLPERHRSIRAVFDQTWQRLSTSEQDLFKKLAVFRGRFSRQAAQKVADASLLLLSSLTNKSLIWRTEDDNCYLHELSRQYAEEKLMESPEMTQTVRRAHSTYYLNRLGDLREIIYGSQQRNIINELRLDLGNIETAWAHAATNRNVALLEVAVHTLDQLLSAIGQTTIAVELGNFAVEHLHTSDATPEDLLTAAVIYALVGHQYGRLGQFDLARHCFEQAITVYEKLSKQPLPGFGTDAWTGLAMIAMVEGRYDDTMQLAEARIKPNQDENDLMNLQVTYYTVAGGALRSGDYAKARTYTQKVYEVATQTDNVNMIGNALVYLGNIALVTHQYDVAHKYYQDALVLLRSVGDIPGVATTLYCLGFVANEKNDTDLALEYLLESEQIYRQIDDVGNLGMALLGLAETTTLRDELVTARRYIEEVLHLGLDIQWEPFMLNGLTVVANVLEREQHVDHAEHLRLYIHLHPATETQIRNKMKDLLQVVKRHTTALPEVTQVVNQHLFWLRHDELPTILTHARSDSSPTRKSNTTDLDALSDRELEILHLLAQGLTNKEIAEQLFVAVGTIKAHNHNIFGKLGVTNRVKAIAEAKARGLID